MLAAVRRFMETGETAAEDESIRWDLVRGGTCVVSEDTPWSAVEYPEAMAPAVR